MRLPEIDTVGVGPAPDVAAPYRSFDKMAQTMAEGFRAYGQEVIKTQTQRAAVDLAKGLNSLQQEIEANKFVTTKYVKEKLGDAYESLDPAVKAQLTTTGLDLTTGKITQFDREDIPTWVVADAIFDAQAKNLLDKSAQNIQVGGWAEEFKANAAVDVLQRKARVNERQIGAMHAYLTEEQTGHALDLVNAGDPDGARAVVNSSRVMDAAYKEKVLDHIAKVEQLTPVYDAIRRQDYGTMAEMVGKLNDPREFTKLAPAERTAFSERLKAEIKQFKTAADDAQKKAFKANADAAWNNLFGIVRAGGTPSYRDIPPPSLDPLQGGMDPTEQKAMMAWVDDRKKGIETKTDLNLYAALTDMARSRPEEFASLSLTSLINRLSPTDFKHFIDLQTKPPGASSFDDFVSTDEAINAKLSAPTEQGGYGFDLKKAKDDSDVAAQVGHVKSLIQHELAALGRRATLQERDEVIDRVLKNEVKVTKHWYGDDRKVATQGVPPQYVVALRRVSADLGFGLSADGIKQTYTDFAYYEDGITQAWGPIAGTRRKLTPDLALGVYGYLKAHWGEIDAELRRVGRLTGKNEIDNAARTALAVQGFISQR